MQATATQAQTQTTTITNPDSEQPQRLFQCSTCKRSFTRADHLTRHVRARKYFDFDLTADKASMVNVLHRSFYKVLVLGNDPPDEQLQSSILLMLVAYICASFLTMGTDPYNRYKIQALRLPYLFEGLCSNVGASPIEKSTCMYGI
jgi:hypothetical protein